jgi:hypothetical protein
VSVSRQDRSIALWSLRDSLKLISGLERTHEQQITVMLVDASTSSTPAMSRASSVSGASRMTA